MRLCKLVKACYDWVVKYTSKGGNTMEPFIVEDGVNAIAFTDSNAQSVGTAYQAWLQDNTVKKEVINISFAAESGVFALIITYRAI